MTDRGYGGHGIRMVPLVEAPTADSGSIPVPTLGITAPLAMRPTFDAIHAEHFAFIWRCLRGLGVAPSAIDDAAQEVLFVVHRRLPEYEPRGPIRAWLFSIIARVAKNQRRSRSRRRDTESIDPALPSSAPGPDVAAEHREHLELVKRFADGLSEAMRAVFVLALLEELPVPEVAAALGLPVNTVYSRVRLLRQQFRRTLVEQNGGER